ncbi:MAG: hypothetical protein K8S62_08265 [Candidatus Sabulitectum sp.]|nr:hypothetical protein [Candidatus Sabulitectum sp.]
MSSTSGYSGPKVKSDILVEFSSQGDRLFLSGFTPEQEQAVLNTSERLEISSGTVTGENSGAAPWVAAARFEAAVRKELGEMFLPLPAAENWTVQSKDRPRRSRLYAPGNKPRFIEKAAAAGADGIILDLEDSVAPDRKDEARILVAYALANIDFGDTEVMVRINQGDRAADDLNWIVPQPVQHILLPKVELSDDVAAIRDMIETVMELCGRNAFPWLMPILESPRGILNALSIADSVPEMAALTLGLQDLTAVRKVPKVLQQEALLFWQQERQDFNPLIPSMRMLRTKRDCREASKKPKPLDLSAKAAFILHRSNLLKVVSCPRKLKSTRPER